MQKCLINCRFLAPGDSYVTLKTRFRMGLSTIHDIIRDTCRAIWITFKNEVMPDPSLERWQEIEKGFRVRWNFPNCLGALDGKHVNIIAPANSASTFHNYGGHFSTVLMALVGANYCFVCVDIGEYGSNSDLRHDLMRPYPRGKEASLPREEAIFNFASVKHGWWLKTLLAFWLKDREFLTEEYLLNQGTWTLLCRQQFVCIISLPLTRISMKSQLNLTQRTFPTWTTRD